MNDATHLDSVKGNHAEFTPHTYIYTYIYIYIISGYDTAYAASGKRRPSRLCHDPVVGVGVTAVANVANGDAPIQYVILTNRCADRRAPALVVSPNRDSPLPCLSEAAYAGDYSLAAELRGMQAKIIIKQNVREAIHRRPHRLRQDYLSNFSDVEIDSVDSSLTPSDYHAPDIMTGLTSDVKSGVDALTRWSAPLFSLRCVP